MPEWNVYQSVEPAMGIQRFFCVSPFYWDRLTGKFETNWKIKSRTIVTVVLPLAIMYFSIFHWNYFKKLLVYVPDGMVCKFLCFYGLASVNLHYVVDILINSVLYPKQMQYVDRMHAIDRKLKEEFDASVDHKGVSRNVTIAIKVFQAYYGAQILMWTLPFIYNQNYIMIPGNLARQLQHFILTTESYAIAHYVFLLRRRYKLLFSICKKMHSERNQWLRSGMSRSEIDEKLLLKIEKLFNMFRETTDLISFFMDEVYGWIYASQIVKTFMWIASQIYFIFLIVTDENLNMNGLALSMIYLYEIGGEVFRIVVNLIAVHTVIQASEKCKYSFRYFDKHSRSKKLRQLCSNFEMWSIHYKIEFRVNNQVPFNAAFIFTTSTGLLSYLLYLIQFRLQEEEMFAEFAGNLTTINL